MAEKYSGIEKYIFSDVYVFFLKYKDMPNTDYNWECCIHDAQLLYLKYQNHPLARAIVTDTIDQISHVVKNTRLCGYSHEEWEKILTASHRMGWTSI